ncbi:MAG TPA: secretin N-terminal domain-containing protein [Burkholderiales bacterium]|nr:secretin N-terminal domain-containing protein [Burkholderiales bacterium]
MNATRNFLALGAVLLASCGTPPAPTSVDGRILGEMEKAGERKPQPRPSAVEQALLPPLRMEMPAVAGKPIEPRFDLSVNAAPAAQVFMSLVSGTRYSMLLHPGVTGTISVSLKDVTLQEALESIRDLYGYEFKIDGSRISVQPAGIQTRVFRVNYLTGQRRGSSDVRVQSGSVADVGAPGTPPQPVSPGLSNQGSNPGNLPVARSIDSSRISTQQLNDFWAELRAALQAIVGTAEGRSVVVTPHSGVVVVRALPSELRGVEHYLRETRLAVERQVMLEAKIIEVTLSDQFQSGINWAAFRTGGTNFAVGQLNAGQGAAQLTTAGGAVSAGGFTANTAAGVASVASTTASASNPASAVFGLALQTSNFAALLTFLESQGSVQVLSSPRVATLNNQKAVLKVGTDEFFVTNVSTVTTTTGTTTQQTPTVTVAPFFSGILLDVTPQIDEDNTIMLHIHPSISEVTESQRVVNLGGTIPSITLPLARSTVSETDTIVRAMDGNIVAIGGLMSVDVRDNRGGIPGVDAALLRNTDRQTRKRELVILLKPTVLQDDRAWEQDLKDTEQRLRNMYPSGGASRR